MRVLLTLWLHAISSGIGSAREIERRVGSDDALRWIAGDERVGRTVLSEFRTHRPQAIDLLFSNVLGTLLLKGLLSLDLVAQDGHLKFDCLRTAEARSVVVLMPVPPPSKDPQSLRGAYDAPIAAFRARIETPEAKELCRARAGLAELPNAHFKDRLGLGQFLVRRLENVTSVALLTGLAFNLSHAPHLLGA